MPRISIIIFLISLGLCFNLLALAEPQTFAANYQGKVGKQPLKLHLFRMGQTLWGYYQLQQASQSDSYYPIKRNFLDGRMTSDNQFTARLFPQGQVKKLWLKGTITGNTIQGQWHQGDNETKSSEVKLKRYTVKSNNYSLVSKARVEQSGQCPHAMYINYPQLQNPNAKAQTQRFNQTVKTFVRGNIPDIYRRQEKVDSQGNRHCPPERAFIDYEVVNLAYPIVSLRFIISNYNAYIATLNYNLAKNKRIQLSELFQKPYSHYLKSLSTYSRKQLTKQLYDNQAEPQLMKWLKRGTGPSQSNFHQWNLRPDGLLISFTKYQIAPGAYGRFELLVPANKLNHQLSKPYRGLFN